MSTQETLQLQVLLDEGSVLSPKGIIVILLGQVRLIATVVRELQQINTMPNGCRLNRANQKVVDIIHTVRGIPAI